MKLFIDTSDSEKVVIGLGDKRFETASRKQKAQRLLPFVKETLDKQKLGLEDISEIEINTGPGSYTGLRVGMAVAKTLSWVLDIPLNGQKISEGDDVDIRYE